MSLALTLSQSLRAQYPSNLDKNEVRPSRYGAWDFFLQDAMNPGSILTPDLLAKIKQSFGHTVAVPVIDAEDVNISNVRSCTIADSENSSKLITLTFATYAFGFSMYPAQHYNNDIKYQADYDQKLRKYLLKLAAVLDQASVATLEAQKNIFWTGVDSFYSNTGNALQVSQAQAFDFYNTASSVLEFMDFYGAPHVIHNPHAKPLVNRLNAQGANNATNQQWQFSPYTFWGTNRILNSANIQATGFLVQEGTCAVSNRNDPDAIQRATGPGMEWAEVPMPIVNLTMGSFYRKDCNDASALHIGTGGLKRTLRESFEFSTDVCFITAYNSAMATRFNPIVKFQITTA